MSDIQITDYSKHAATWNSTMPLPKSHDGEVAQRCTKFGIPNNKGRFIKWTELSPAGEVLIRVAKLVKPEEKIQPIDVGDMSREINTNPKYQIEVAKSYNKMQSRISKVFVKMGVGYLAARSITEPSPKTDVCMWGVDEQQNERILINPYVLMGRMVFARGIMQREVIHRALCRGRENLGDLALSRLVMDICANRLMAATATGAKSKAWTKTCQFLYPEESKKTVLALCNAAMDENDLRVLRAVNPVYADLWSKLYEVRDQEVDYITPKKKQKKKKVLRNKVSFDIQHMNPDDLYFRLRAQLTDADRAAMQKISTEEGLNPFGVDVPGEQQKQDGQGDGDGEGQQPNQVKMPNGSVLDMKNNVDITPTAASKAAEQAMRKQLVPKKMRRGINWNQYSDCRTEFWDTFVKNPDDLHDPELEKYARRIHTDKILRNVSGRIAEVLENDVASEPYPHLLSEEGMMMAFIGLRPPVYPLFQNIKGTEGKKRIVVFFDLSPSMNNFFAHMMYMCDCFEDMADIVFAMNDEGDPGVLTFAGSVRELTKDEIAKMRTGELKVGASTSFNAMTEYCIHQINTEDVDAVVVFTDGQSGLSDENRKAFNATGKRMYRVYMQEDIKENRGKQIRSALDALPGESYTVNVPQTDMEYSR